MIRKKSIRCRVLIPCADGFREFADIPSEKQSEFTDKCVGRMGTALNERFSRDSEMYQKVVENRA